MLEIHRNADCPLYGWAQFALICNVIALIMIIYYYSLCLCKTWGGSMCETGGSMCETGPLLSLSHGGECPSPVSELSRQRLFTPEVPSAATVMAAAVSLGGSQAGPESCVDQAKDRNNSVLGWRLPWHRKK